MSLDRHILDLARIETGAAADEKARVRAFDRPNAMLSSLDSEASVLLRFNAIVVAVARRTSFYAWAWRFAVVGGLGFAAIIVVDVTN